MTTEGQRKHHVVCLSGTKTEGTKTFCPYGGAAVAAVGRAKQSAPGFRGLTIAQTFPMENRHSVRNSKNNKGHKFSGLNNRINQETPNHEVHAHVNSQVDCTQGCTRVPEGLRFNELLSSGGRRGRLDCFRPGSIRGCFQCQTSGNNT